MSGDSVKSAVDIEIESLLRDIEAKQLAIKKKEGDGSLLSPERQAIIESIQTDEVRIALLRPPTVVGVELASRELTAREISFRLDELENRIKGLEAFGSPNVESGYVTHPWRDRQHVIVDLETLDTVATAYAWEMGAVVVGPGVNRLWQSFSKNISHVVKDWRTRSEETRAWTEEHGHIMESAVASQAGSDPKEVLEEFVKWLDQFDNPMLWSWGKDFDFPILSMHAEKLGVKLPYRYTDVHCIRDLWQSQNPDAKESPTRHAKHRALEDAIAEAEVLQECLAKLPDIAPLNPAPSPYDQEVSG